MGLSGICGAFQSITQRYHLKQLPPKRAPATTACQSVVALSCTLPCCMHGIRSLPRCRVTPPYQWLQMLGSTTTCNPLFQPCASCTGCARWESSRRLGTNQPAARSRAANPIVSSATLTHTLCCRRCNKAVARAAAVDTVAGTYASEPAQTEFKFACPICHSTEFMVQQPNL